MNESIDKRIQLLLEEFLFHISATSLDGRTFTPINYEPTFTQFYYWLMERNADYTDTTPERERLLKEDRL